MNTVLSSSVTANPWVILGVVVIVLLLLWILSFWVKSTGGAKEALVQEYHRLKGMLVDITEIDPAAQQSVKRDFIIQSDIWLDKVLLYNGMAEATVGEKLKSQRLRRRVERKVLDDLWTLHKLRNRIVHDNHKVTSGDFDQALMIVDKIKRTLI